MPCEWRESLCLILVIFMFITFFLIHIYICQLKLLCNSVNKHQPGNFITGILVMMMGSL